MFIAPSSVITQLSSPDPHKFPWAWSVFLLHAERKHPFPRYAPASLACY